MRNNVRIRPVINTGLPLPRRKTSAREITKTALGWKNRAWRTPLANEEKSSLVCPFTGKDVLERKYVLW
jgi:hypothetical protein